MRRRETLRLVGAAGLAGLAGCSGLAGEGTETLTPAPGTAPDCPASAALSISDTGSVDRYCNTADGTPAERRTAVVPDGRTARLPDAHVRFTLTNRRSDHLNVNLEAWELHKQAAGAWHHLGRSRWTGSGDDDGLAPGASHEWTVTVENGDLGAVVEPVRGRSDVPLRALGGGTYAFLVHGSYGAPDEKPFENASVSYATRWSLAGDALDLVMSDSVNAVERDGDSVVVRDGGVTGSPNEALVLTRTDPGPAVEPSQDSPFIAEEVYGKPALRNALAAFEAGVRRVEVRTDRRRGLGIRDRKASFRFDGTEYVAERVLSPDDG